MATRVGSKVNNNSNEPRLIQSGVRSTRSNASGSINNNNNNKKRTSTFRNNFKVGFNSSIPPNSARSGYTNTPLMNSPALSARNRNKVIVSASSVYQDSSPDGISHTNGVSSDHTSSSMITPNAAHINATNITNMNDNDEINVKNNNNSSMNDASLGMNVSVE